MAKKIQIGVADFAHPVPLQGSIDIYSGLYKPQEKGILLHQEIQQSLFKQFANYQAEVPVTKSFTRSGYHFQITGRVDGVYRDNSVIRLEEIKSAFQLEKLIKILKENPDHPYCLQLKTYGYFYWLQTAEVPELSLYVVSSRNKRFEILPIPFEVSAVAAWFEARLNQLVVELQAHEKTIKKRKKTQKNLSFPYPQLRESQNDLIKTVEESLKNKKPLLVQAPTGMGKTLGVTYPVLSNALARGQQTLYITPKNSQHVIAETAAIQLSKAKNKVRSVTLTAKSKICFKEEPMCNPEYCEFAKNHYTKMAEHDIENKISKLANITTLKLRDIAKKYEVCPYELQFIATKSAEVIIADYHYVFGYSTSPLIQKNYLNDTKPNLIIDEAHNLPARSMDIFSGSLSAAQISALLSLVNRIKPSFQEKAAVLIEQSVLVMEGLYPDLAMPAKVASPVKLFEEHNEKIQKLLQHYLESDAVIDSFDPIMKLSFYWNNFIEDLKLAEQEEFFITYNPATATLVTVCCDASRIIKDCYQQFDNVVGFSATLKPFEFYTKLSGLSDTALACKEFISPFPAENRKLIIIPQISTRFNDRHLSYSKIGEVILRIRQIKKGNYFIFFPSYEFMRKVVAYLKEAPHPILCQTPGMNKDDIKSLIDKLKAQEENYLVFAIQGGVLAEGIDYPGDIIIGAFIIGPPIPLYHFENKEKRNYYDKQYNSQGLAYTYIYPAMAKAIQSAGRVIRSEHDKGLIILMDNRFLQDNFSACMPSNWFDKNPRELISKQILSDIQNFWHK